MAGTERYLFKVPGSWRPSLNVERRFCAGLGDGPNLTPANDDTQTELFHSRRSEVRHDVIGPMARLPPQRLYVSGEGAAFLQHR